MQMNTLTIFVQSLRLKGPKNALEVTERHNRRLIAGEFGGYGRIDVTRSPLNMELIPLNGISLEERVKKIIADKGIDLNHYQLKKKNRGYAIEFIFTVTSGHQCDFNAMYAQCLEIMGEYYPECPVVHAVIHHDEDTPHMHVIVVPFKDGKLQGDKVKGYKGVSQARNRFFFDKLNPTHGLTFPAYFKGSLKKRAVELALQGYRRLPDSDLRNFLDSGISQAIHSRPEPFLVALGITYDQVLVSNETTPT